MSAEVVRAAKTEIGLESFGDTVIKLKWNLLLGIRFNFFRVSRARRKKTEGELVLRLFVSGKIKAKCRIALLRTCAAM